MYTCHFTGPHTLNNPHLGIGDTEGIMGFNLIGEQKTNTCVTAPQSYRVEFPEQC